ncbi:MAG: hypothetical protein A3C85_03150 [Candidatus Doudnabacteria bacterium RIFCSPHIGHO2_02_FULL_48_21]|uniref:Uncharacterized protein n=1 Tax=Candidatus Doudnabacteria bacterium RIFCSPLOWO2_02_FULL_48_13 TaxID=1817845 RepID=A0A1F5QCB2_9BACT|nr:MAG: hypothetical protein A3K05_02400 [Candidatus Doudnabacteria bacterium RIFCSPHIGHO2_01_48_18]OGE91270.1 MAG: hypothetical protein A3F44_04580 [Candidatus Doudnabacteria bacterium RIFCSPHIGHO2_12_FULL_47_25]OGE93525.1 MAG: hypothetical protein A3C85_03150 [Candidatus Doudnabacteria bacterium RIFCSPHIGHO2_02_FULL_48_21]OGE99796.1 MAG: hypothetical protein A3J05_00805 [Candidatus Doudnabacteria bacterium RIFCSPLOWO2_02_FULL_48_13]OGF00527.1 MAG: hypothetical protein A3G07_02405 [Candidatus 
MSQNKKFNLVYLFLIILPLVTGFLVDNLDLSKTVSKNIINILFAVAIVGCVIVLRLNKTIGNNSLARYIFVGILAIFLFVYIYSLNSLSNFGF